MFSLLLKIDEKDRDRSIADLWEAGTVGITEEDDGSLRAFFGDLAETEAVCERFGVCLPEIRQEEDRDWVTESLATWQPFVVGERFFLVPHWRNDAAPQDRLRLRIYPGLASGTGLHSATQLALRALEQIVKPGLSVLDIGTGSGILSEAAHLLGAGTVVACDIDADAAAIAARNLGESRVNAEVFAGSLRSLRRLNFNVAVGNLNLAAISSIAGDLREMIDRQARVILTGFQEAAAPRVLELLGGHSPQTRLEQDGWAALIF